MRSMWAGGVMLALLATSGASAEGTKLTAGPEVQNGNPWVVCNGAPPPRYYPAAAQKAGIEGLTKVQCRPKADGTMSACSWIEENPTGQGFGQNAAALACIVKISSVPGAELDALPPDLVVQFPMRFKLPK